MTLMRLDIPAGFYRNGTDLEQSGRWRDGSLVRWRDNSLRPIGGWRERKTSFCTNPVRGMHTWETNAGNAWLAGGSHDELFVMTGGGSLTNLTPTDLATGRQSAAANLGYGGQEYGYGYYGQPRQLSQNSVPLPATTWSMDNWGEYLVACHSDDGRILQWDLERTSALTLLADENTGETKGGAVTYEDTTFPSYDSFDPLDPYTSGGVVEGVVTAGFGSTTGLHRFYSMPIKKGFTYAGAHLIKGSGLSTQYDILYSINYDTLTGFTRTNSVTYGNGVDADDTYEFTAEDDGTLMVQVQASLGALERFEFWYTLYSEDEALGLPNAPQNNSSILVTEERFIFALGAGGNPRKVQWCAREDNTDWTPLATNEAGDIELQTNGQIMQGVRTRGQTLIITDTDAHTARYLGPPYVYGFERVGTSCGAISRKSASDVDIGVFWMGQRGFFRFDGNAVSEIACDVHDYVFGDFNVAQQSKVWSVANGQYGEIWWFYCSSNSTEIDRYVAFDYKENHWLIGELSRTSGVQRGVFRYPLMAGYNADSAIYDHEVGYNFDSSTTFAETGPISIGAGDQIAKVTKLIPDEKTQGDVNVTFKTRFYPNATETTHGPFTPANPTSVRFSGRQLRMRVEGQTATQWKVGNMRIDTIAGGRR